MREQVQKCEYLPYTYFSCLSGGVGQAVLPNKHLSWSCSFVLNITLLKCIKYVDEEIERRTVTFAGGSV